MTHREATTWDAYLEEEWNNPSRSDYYLMQIAGAVEHVLSKRRGYKASDYEIKFTPLDADGKPIEEKRKPKRPPTKEELDAATARANRMWMARLGIKPEKVTGLPKAQLPQPLHSQREPKLQWPSAEQL